MGYQIKRLSLCYSEIHYNCFDCGKGYIFGKSHSAAEPETFFGFEVVCPGCRADRREADRLVDLIDERAKELACKVSE
jgi:hypothetical protein